MVEQEIILRRKLDLLLRTGKILVESAADTNRIVRNMQRVAAYLGLPEERSGTILPISSPSERGLPAAVSVSCSAATGSLSYSPLSPLLPVFVFARVAWSSASIYI